MTPIDVDINIGLHYVFKNINGGKVTLFIYKHHTGYLVPLIGLNLTYLLTYAETTD